MPLVIPEILKNPSRISFALRKNTNVSKSAFDRSRQVVELVGGGWVASATWDILSDEQVPAMRSFLTAISGGVESFYFSDVSAPIPQTGITGAMTVTGTPNIGTISVSTTHNSTKIFSAGDYIAIPITGGEHEYKMVLYDAVTGVTGEADIVVRPVIRGSVAVGLPLVYNNPTGVFLTTDDYSQWSIDAPLYSQSITINAEELF